MRIPERVCIIAGLELDIILLLRRRGVRWDFLVELMPFFDLGVPAANGLDPCGVVTRGLILPLRDSIDAIVISAGEEKAAQEQRPRLFPWVLNPTAS